MVLHQCDHQQGHSACGGRNHTRAPPYESDNHSDAERGVEANLRINSGDDRKGDGLRDQSQCHDEAGENVATYIGQPVLLDCLQHQ